MFALSSLLVLGVFADFSSDDLERLVGGARVASFEANEAIAHYGDEAAHFAVVLDGAVSASVDGGGGARHVLGRFGAGDTFGEASLMNGEPMLADFIAEAPSNVLFIPRALFQSVRSC